MDDMNPTPAEQSSEPEAQIEAPQADAPEAAESDAVPSRRDAIAKALESIQGRDDETPEGEAPEGDDKGQPRGPDGKFATKDAGKPSESDEDAKPEDGEADERSPIGEAPARFSADAKAAWKDAPKAVQGEIHRAITEMERGLAQKDEALRPLQPFFDLAKQHGVTVHDTLGKYVDMEQTLIRDPRAGFTKIANNLGMTLPEMLSYVTGQPPQAAEVAKDREILGLRQELAQVRAQIGGVQQTFKAQQETAVTQQVEKFAADHPRFDELGEEIANMLESGYAKSLDDAYSKAERLNPLPAPAVDPQPDPPAQTRKSLTGAPSSGSNPASRRPSGSRTEALERAFHATGLS